MRSALLSLCFPFFYFHNYAIAAVKDSTFTLSGRVISAADKAVANANVLLYGIDSVLTGTTISDETGNFEFVLRQGTYYISISSVGKTGYSTGLLTVAGDTALPAILLGDKVNALAGASVAAKKPLIERRGEALVMNVSNSITAAGNSAYELLSRCPNVYVDVNENISVKGKNGVIVMMDGKRIPMEGTNLASFLKGIPASSIEEIHIITNPSAKYDASGSAGIIDIKLKKDSRMGTNGSINLAFLHGRYAKTNNGISLNHRNKKLNLFGSYNQSYREGYNKLDLVRKFYTADKLAGAYDQKNYLLFPVSSQLVRAGADYYIGKKTIIGAVLNGTDTRFNPKGENESVVLDSNGTKASSFETQNRSKDHWWNYSANLNLKHTIDTSGREFSMDLDQMSFGNATTQLFTTRYFDLNHEEYQPAYLLYGDIKGSLDIYSAKADYTDPSLGKYKLESGIKSSYVKADNDLKFYNRSSGTDIFDTTKSNHFIYREHINASYVNVSRDTRKWFLQGGLRYEQTNITGQQLVLNKTLKTDYYQLFPTANIVYKLHEKHELGFSVTRRIDRPTYDQLNPFKFFLDPTTYKEGNPYLKPQLTWSYDLSHTYNQALTTSFTYTRTSRNITEVIFPDEAQPKVTIQTDRNITFFELAGFNVSAYYKPLKAWNGYLSSNSYYSHYTGNLANTPLNNGRITFNINSTNTFTLSKTWTAELNANYRAPELYGYMNIKSTWFVNAGVQAKILNSRGIIKFAINDIFFTQKTRATSIFNQYYESFKVQRDTRVASIAFNYRFGNSGVPAARRRQSGAEEEKRRASKGNVG